MAQFDDPSIISLVSAVSDNNAGASAFENNKDDNAITKFLREAEYKREEEEAKKSGFTTEQKGTEIGDDESTNAQSKELELEDWKLELGPYNNNERLRYSMDYLYSLKDSSDNVVPQDLPPKSYYRLKNKPIQRTNWSGNQYNNNNGNYNGRNNYNEGGPATGSMGNFNLNKKPHDRGFNRYGNNNNNNRRNNRDHRHKKQDDDDSWLAELEKDEPAGGSAEDFEKWKAKIKLAERKRRGEIVDEEEITPSSTQRSEENKNTIDSFFSVAKPSTKSGGSSNAGTPDVTKNSKFFSFFKPESGPAKDEQSSGQQSSGNDGVSKILSLLDSGEKNAKAGSNNSTPLLTKASPLQSPQVQSQQPQQGRTQFNFQQPSSGQPQPPQQPSSSAPVLPPGLAPPSNQGLPAGGSKDSFFMSLLNRGPESAKIDSTPNAQSPKVSTNDSKQSPSLPNQEQPRSSLPPGLQGPPGLPQQNQQQHSQQPGLQGQPMIPPQFQNGQNRGQGQMPPVPPGFNPQQLPPWLAQQFPPNLPQGGRFMPPPPPNGMGFPPQMRQNGPPGASNIPPHLLYPQGAQQGGQSNPPVFYPPFGAPNPDGQHQQQQQQQQRFPPGFFNGPPPPGFQGRDSNQQ